MKIKDVQKAVKELKPSKSTWPTLEEVTERSKKTHAALMELLKGHRVVKRRTRVETGDIVGLPKIISK